VRKYLGVLAGVTTLCVASWAQAAAPVQTPDQAPAQTQGQTPPQTPDQTPAPAPPEATPIPTPTRTNTPAPARPYPRMELFAGGSYAEAGLFNAGHWAGLPGWDASLGLNLTRWLGFLVDGGQYFGTSKIPTAVPAPFPTCPPFCPTTSPTFDATTREYDVLFGAQFSRRKYEGWTPFGELLYGHQGTRGKASAHGETFTEIGTGRALVAGGVAKRIGAPRTLGAFGVICLCGSLFFAFRVALRMWRAPDSAESQAGLGR